MHNKTEQEHIEANAVERYTRDHPLRPPQLVALQLLHDLSKSYEYYAACNKPKEEWDEYDYMMYPIWLRLKEFLGE